MSIWSEGEPLHIWKLASCIPKITSETVLGWSDVSDAACLSFFYYLSFLFLCIYLNRAFPRSPVKNDVSDAACLSFFYFFVCIIYRLLLVSSFICSHPSPATARSTVVGKKDGLPGQGGQKNSANGKGAMAVFDCNWFTTKSKNISSNNHLKSNCKKKNIWSE